MIDMEQTVYDILTTTLTGMKWSCLLYTSDAADE